MTPPAPPSRPPKLSDKMNMRYVDVPETPTGRYRALKKEIKAEKVWTVATAIIALLLSLGAVFGGYRTFMSDAKAQTTAQIDAGLKNQTNDIEAIKTEQKDLRANQKEVLVEVKEMRLDLREAYKAQRYDRPSPRLDKPPLSADGGQ